VAELEVSAAYVYRAAQEFLDTRARAIARDREELVTKAMRKRKYWLFGPRLTREEAIQYLKNDRRYLSSWDEVQLRGASRANHVRALRDLAKLSGSGGLMTLTHEDVSVLPTLVSPT
jgi:hypothetical protein